MLVRLERERLLDTLRRIGGFTPKSKSDSACTCEVGLRLEGGRLEVYSSGAHGYAAAMVPAEGEDGACRFVRPEAVSKLTAIVNAAPKGAKISLTFDGGEKLAVVSDGVRGRSTLQAYQAEAKRPEIPETAMAVVYAVDFRDAIGAVAHAANPRDMRYALRDFCLDVREDGLEVACTDGRRVAFRSVSECFCGKKRRLSVLLTYARALARLLESEEGKVTLCADGSRLGLGTESAYASLVLSAYEFPNYRLVLEDSYPASVVVPRSLLLQAVKLASQMTSESFRRLDVRFDPGRLRLEARDEHGGHAEVERESEEIRIESKDGVEIEFAVNCDYLLEALTDNLVRPYVRLKYSSPTRPLLFEGGEYAYEIVMPMKRMEAE